MFIFLLFFIVDERCLLLLHGDELVAGRVVGQQVQLQQGSLPDRLLYHFASLLHHLPALFIVIKVV